MTDNDTNAMPWLADELRDRREAMGLTQAALADLAGIYPGRVSDYERGTRVPSLATLAELAAVLGPFRIESGPRDVAFYRRMFEGASMVNAQLCARALYAKLYGSADEPEFDRFRELTRQVLAEHGESVSAETALELIDTRETS